MANVDLATQIEAFSGWFGSRLSYVKTLKDEELAILSCCSLIDALAKCIYQKDSGGKRFKSILENFSDKKIWTRISVYHLTEDEQFKALKINPNVLDGLGKKSEWAKNKSEIRDYDVDPLAQEIGELYFLSQLGKFLDMYKYSSIFYRWHRCGLVHEARIAAKFHWDFCQGDRPYYISYIDTDNIDRKHLIFPLKFIIAETETINTNVKKWLITEKINPYDRYSFEPD